MGNAQALDAPCDGSGTTGQQTIDALKAEYHALYTPPTWVPGGPTALSIRLVYEGGKVFCHPATYTGKGNSSLVYPAWLQVEVNMDFTTSDGTFAEKKMPATISVYYLETGNMLADPSVLYFSSAMAVSDMKGTYQPVSMGSKPGDTSAGCT